MSLMSHTLDIRAYRAMVAAAMDQALRTKQPVYFGNTGPAHAAVVLELMLAHAKSSVDIVSGFLDKTVWQSANIKRLADRAKHIEVRILLDELTETAIPTGSALSEVGQSDQIKVKRLSSPLGLHLCVVDSMHVRLESLQKTHEASVTFGDGTAQGPAVSAVFRTLWEKLHNAPLLNYGPALIPA